MRWIGAFVLGNVLWFVITIVAGILFSFTGLEYLSSWSDFLNFAFYPLGLWLGFKVTKTPFLGSSGNSKEKSSTEMTTERAEEIIQDYGATLEHSAPTAGCVADVEKLPHSKERIKEAIALVLPEIDDAQLREYLKVGYMNLADWQEGVGDEQIGLDLTNMDTNADPLEMAKQVSSQGDAMEKWTPMMQTEREALKAEIEKLG